MNFFMNYRSEFVHPIQTDTIAFRVAQALLTLFFIAALLPPIVVYDGSTMRFFFMSCVNVLAIVYHFVFAKHHLTKTGFSFWNIPLLWCWLPLLLLMGLSLFWAINVSEAVVVFNRWLIVFLAFVNCFLLFQRYPAAVSLFVYLCFGVAILHLFYLFIPYYATGIHLYKHHIGYLNGFHGNKNIFAVFMLFINAGIVYMLFFGRKPWRTAAAIVFFFLSMAVLLLNARATFISFTLQILFILCFAIVLGFRTGQWKRFLKRGLLIGVIGLGGFFGGEGLKLFNHHVFYIPYAKEHNLPSDIGVQSVFFRIKTIGDPEGGARYRIWRNACSVRNEYPLTGSGIGNFKIAVQKYESPQKGYFVTSDHAHCDFFEMGAELGYIGSTLYLIWILSVGAAIVRLLFSKKTSMKALRLTLLGTLLWIAYVIDAAFNFPSDRAEVQWMGTVGFAIIALALLKTYGKRRKAPISTFHYFIVISALGMIGIYSTAVGGIHYRSSILQRKIIASNNLKKCVYSPEEWKEKFPGLPNIDENARPLAIHFAKQYALHGDYGNAINELLPDISNPYYGMREYHLSIYYDKMGQSDSAIYWAEQCRTLKPLLYHNVNFLSKSYLLQGDTMKAKSVLEDYLEKCAIQEKDKIGYRIKKEDKAKILSALSRISSPNHTASSRP